MRPVTVMFSAAANGRALSIDRDTVLSWVASSSITVVSCDQSDTTANVVSTPADRNSASIIAVLSTTGENVIFTDFPLSKGEQIYLSKAGSGAVSLFFTDQV